MTFRERVFEGMQTIGESARKAAFGFVAAAAMVACALCFVPDSAFASDRDDKAISLSAGALSSGVELAADGDALLEEANGEAVVEDDASNDDSKSSAGDESDSEETVPFEEATVENGDLDVVEPPAEDVKNTLPAIEPTSALDESKLLGAEPAPTKPVIDGWREEDGLTYYYEGGERRTGWLVTDTYKDYGLQRYFLGTDHALVFDRLISEADAGWWAYATKFGYVVRGRYVAPDGKVYLANNDGRLEDEGWLVTGDYDNGVLQRYYIDRDAHAALTGSFTVGKDAYCGLEGVGYVLRGAAMTDAGLRYADNDGVLVASGWLVTEGFGRGMQRYWFDSYSPVFNRLVSEAEAGWWAFATEFGHVVRGRYVAPDGRVYLANNDGRLEDTGWLVTNSYDGSFQRYYIDDDTHATRIGFFSQDGNDYYGLAAMGYVLRGLMQYSQIGVLMANNDGVMPNREGWLVSDEYEGVLERYRVDHCCDGYLGAHVGLFSIDGSTYIGLAKVGHVLRNDYDYSNGHWYESDNDGVCLNVDNRFSRIEACISWIVGIANDDSHGYDQVYRWGERGDYDCSSLVISSLDAAGYETGWATYTGNMRGALTTYGWTWLNMGSGLKRCDILLNERDHTAIYLGDGMLVQASGNEQGGITGGKPGDQTGREIWSCAYYDYPWNGILRYIC